MLNVLNDRQTNWINAVAQCGGINMVHSSIHELKNTIY
jgi:hypothetical protein